MKTAMLMRISRAFIQGKRRERMLSLNGINRETSLTPGGMDELHPAGGILKRRLTQNGVTVPAAGIQLDGLCSER